MKCNPLFDHQAMTIALYDLPDGRIVRRIIDPGEGVPFRSITVDERWWKVELASGEIGYIDTNEPFGTLVELD
jgi:hypothetical protein